MNNLCAAQLVWGSAHDAEALCDAHGPFDVAVGSELLYREDSVSSLVETIQALGVPTVVLAQQTRPAGNFDIEHTCTRMMERIGYSVARATIPGCPAVIYTFSEGGVPCQEG